MILFIEPISRNIGIYVPAYPLPIMELASFVKHNLPKAEIAIISIPVDYGVPVTGEGRERVYRKFLEDLSKIKPRAVGISCTAIAQAEEAIYLSELIKGYDPDIFVFWGGYFPTLYYEEVFSKTSAVDLIVIGEGEAPALAIVKLLEKGKDKILLPSDIAVGDKFEESAARKEVDANSIPSGWRGLDIGPNTIKKYVDEISGSKTVVWNGPMGVFEFAHFSNGTKAIAEALADKTTAGACTIIGGGDTVSAIKKFGLQHKVTHISTGGGASLQLLAGKKLPGVEALKVA